MTVQLPDFRLEVYFGEWEFNARHHLTASDAETLTIGELLAFADEDARARSSELRLGYAPTWGGRRAAGRDRRDLRAVEPSDVLAFAGAEEAMFWALQELVGPGDHAIVTVPNYQSMETLPLPPAPRSAGSCCEPDAAGRWTSTSVARAAAARHAAGRGQLPQQPDRRAPDRGDLRARWSRCATSTASALFSDEVYRGLELDPAATLPQAADLSPTAISLNVMSKAYGLPGLRIGWLACRDHDLLARLERRKHYTSICNAGPSEALATIALRARRRDPGPQPRDHRRQPAAVRRVLRPPRRAVRMGARRTAAASLPALPGDDGVERSAASWWSEAGRAAAARRASTAPSSARCPPIASGSASAAAIPSPAWRRSTSSYKEEWTPPRWSGATVLKLRKAGECRGGGAGLPGGPICWGRGSTSL